MSEIRETIWHKISDKQPKINNRIFISDGECLAVARFTKFGSWEGEGFSGYEWDLEFFPIYWAEITINLPVSREIE